MLPRKKLYYSVTKISCIIPSSQVLNSGQNDVGDKYYVQATP